MMAMFSIAELTGRATIITLRRVGMVGVGTCPKSVTHIVGQISWLTQSKSFDRPLNTPIVLYDPFALLVI